MVMYKQTSYKCKHKTKDTVIYFGNKHDFHPILLNGTIYQQVGQTMLLGVIIQSDLKWNAHYTNQKAAMRLHYIKCLKKAGLPSDELL